MYKCNYNIKKIEFTLDNDIYNYLIVNLPNSIHCWNSKDEFSNRIFKMPSGKALNEYKWIEYNQDWVNQLIIDIDDKNLNMNQLIDKCLDIGIEPTWICETDKGFQISFGLLNVIQYKWEKTIIYARSIKAALTWYLGGDVNGSHRLKGIWRNPLLHNYSFGDVVYDLNDFKEVLKLHYQSFKSINQNFKTHINRQKIINDNFKFNKGNRNNFLFYQLMISSKNKRLDLQGHINLLNQIQEDVAANVEKLSVTDLNAIAKSVHNYNINNKNFIKIRDNTCNVGALGFKSIYEKYGRYLNEEEYKEEVKARQIAAAEYTKNLKGMKMTRIANMKKINAKKVDMNEKKVHNIMTGLYCHEYKKKMVIGILLK